MSPFQELSLEITRWLQANYGQLEPIMSVISQLGGTDGYLLLLPLIYWCYDKRLGKHLTYIIILSFFANGFFKHAFREPRPFWVDPAVGLTDTPSYGTPSGHVQTASLGMLMLATWFRRVWVWIAAVVVILVMALSRIYLGAHFLGDVLFGLALAILFLVGYWIFRRYGHARFQNRILGQRLLPFILLPAILMVIYGLLVWLLGDTDSSVAWADILPQAERDTIDDVVTALGLIAGSGVAFPFEASRVRMIEKGKWTRRVLRYLLGIVITVVLWFGSGAIVPDDPIWLGIPLRFIRYAVIGAVIAYYLPWLFVKLRLAEALPASEVGISVNKDGIMKRD